MTEFIVQIFSPVATGHTTFQLQAAVLSRLFPDAHIEGTEKDPRETFYQAMTNWPQADRVGWGAVSRPLNHTSEIVRIRTHVPKEQAQKILCDQFGEANVLNAGIIYGGVPVVTVMPDMPLLYETVGEARRFDYYAQVLC